MLAYLGFEGAIEVLHDALRQFVPENLTLAQRCIFGNRPAPRARRHRLRGSQSTTADGRNLSFDTRGVTLGLFSRKGASDAAERFQALFDNARVPNRYHCLSRRANGSKPVHHPALDGLVWWDRHFMLDVRRLQRRFEEHNDVDLRDIKGDRRQMTERLLWERTWFDSRLATGGSEHHHDHDFANRQTYHGVNMRRVDGRFKSRVPRRFRRCQTTLRCCKTRR